MTIFGIDVSSYQYGMSLAGLPGQGYRFVIARASIGAANDGLYRGFADQADAAGLLFAAYHFLLPNDAVNLATQAQVFAAQLDATGQPAGMLDVEPDGPGSRTPSMGDVLGFLAMAREFGAAVRLLYFPRWVWDAAGRPDLSRTGCALVSSNYGANNRDYGSALYPGTGWGGWGGYGGLTPAIGQVGSRGVIDGYDGDVDIDVTELSEVQLEALFTKGVFMPGLSDTQQVDLYNRVVAMTEGTDSQTHTSPVDNVLARWVRLISEGSFTAAAGTEGHGLLQVLDEVKALRGDLANLASKIGSTPSPTTTPTG